MDPARIVDEFPAPSFRGAQEQALADIRDAFSAGNDVVLVRAPTGSGKSLLARAICGAAATVEESRPRDATDAYYTTPQVSQLDDVADDPLLDDFQIIRGKRNYNCILNGEENTPVNQAPCARQRGFDCSVKHRCPYYSARAIASNRKIAAMTLAYFMQTAGSDVFRKRDVVVIDEAHGLADWAEMYATIDLNPRTVPVWDELRVPDIEGADDPLERSVRFADGLVDVCTRAKDDLLEQSELSPDDVARRDRLQELLSELKWFVEDARDPQSPTSWVVDQPDGAGTPITVKPLDPERYLRHTVWDRGNKFALLSATILNKEAFCRGVGLDPRRVALVDVPHTFPLENRPLFDVTQGKMTYEHRDETVPKIARLLVRLMAMHPNEKGLVHCHSYSIQERLHERLAGMGVAARVQAHGRDDRNEALEAWKERSRPDLFLSVKMEEALDLEGDLCRWQVICKAPYLNTSDSRVKRRLEDGQWSWYHRAALRTVIQACGRVVRGPEDYGSTYLADSSLLDLFDRARSDLPPWFAEQVEAMRTPDLPDFDPAGALRGVDETPQPTKLDRDARASTSRGSGSKSASASSSSASSSSSSSSSSSNATGNSSSRNTSSSQESSSDESRRHPLSDVWGE